ncbi:MAG: hypothetical protein HUU15_09985 [Candidatus Brocadiae bacterium]|nr:hypothetical protein [Candidatus Brocadiia bacterium]
MDSVMLWGRTFPIVGIVVCIILIVVLKKVFGKSGPDSGLNTGIFILFIIIVACVGVAVWGFRNVKAPDHSGSTWK